MNNQLEKEKKKASVREKIRRGSPVRVEDEIKIKRRDLGPHNGVPPPAPAPAT